MTTNNDQTSKRVPKSGNLCAYCMGFTFFTLNKNPWFLGNCDLCGTPTRVKAETREYNEAHAGHQSPVNKLSQSTAGEENSGRFWKKIEKALVALSA